MGSPRVRGQKEVLARIALHGLTGPLDGHSYREVMAPNDKHDDEWIAAVLSYIRQDWGNLASIIRPSEVASVRAASRNRYRAWTIADLEHYSLPELTDRSAWRADSSAGAQFAVKAINGKSDSCDNPNRPGRWIQVDLGNVHTVTALRLSSSNNDRYPRRWNLTVSNDGENWTEPVADGIGDNAQTLISMEPIVGQYFRVTQTGEDPHHRWSVSDIKVFGKKGNSQVDSDATPAVNRLTPEQLLKSSGDAKRGAVVFERTCSKCHIVGGKGTSFGPDLSRVATRLKKTAIIQSILDPDAVVDAKHRGEMIVTTQGKVISGFVESESDDAVTIRSANRDPQRIPIDQIDDRLELKTSFMPSGIDRTMSQQELQDLIEYLTRRK